MILVTGAAGKTGRAVTRALSRSGQRVRAFVRREEQVAAARAEGAKEVVVGDLRDPAALARAADGARSIYHICPNVSPFEVEIGRAAIGAARRVGVERFVFHSVLHPQTEAMPHHWKKLRVEEALFESGLAFTILQPASYMQNVLAGWERIARDGVYGVPYAVETRLDMVDLEDVADAAAVVLTRPGYDGATYELAGPEALTPVEVAGIFDRRLRRTVRAVRVPADEWAAGARASGLGDYQIATLQAMFQYYERFGFWGNPGVLRWLLGRPPTTFEGFVERAVSSWPGARAAATDGGLP